MWLLSTLRLRGEYRMMDGWMNGWMERRTTGGWDGQQGDEMDGMIHLLVLHFLFYSESSEGLSKGE